MTNSPIIALSLLWILYFGIHSLLASLACKQWIAVHLPTLLSKYRIVYNVIAVALVIPPLLLTFIWRGPPIWEWSGVYAWLANTLAITAVGGFIWTIRGYDMGEFLGLKQLRQGAKTIEDQESFHISPLHRFVRHPWYSLGLVIIWTRTMDSALLITACFITLYFLLGSQLEETKLLRYHGPAYQRYRERVPRLIPLPWKYLTHHEATDILALAKNKVSSPPKSS
jgi:protein-S-isoprenylcysteine O-methyltransferase Ste14